eukprot:c11563_g3_i1 orf=94-1920(-)
MALSLRRKQTDAVIKILNLNQSVVSGGTPDEEVFKILIFDSYCRDVLSPLIRANELRKHGITLSFMIDKERQRIPDVPAIYLVQPTSDNVDRIIKDASMGIYESFHLNFSSPLPRSYLEKLAAGTLKGDCAHRISKVYDQYLNFVTLDHGMFSLAQPQTYVQLNDPKAQDKDVEAVVESIVNGLFCVLVTLGIVPWIRCPKGGPAEMVATQLDSRLREHLASRNNLFAGSGQLGSSFQRPLLCIFDRNFELTAAVQHFWTYRSMVHDVLGMKLNKVVLGGKSYELDESDSFWKENCSVPFPRVAEEVQEQLNKYKQEVDAVNRRTGSKSEIAIDEQEVLGNTRHLMSAVNSLPELTERKRMIDKHTNLAFALLDNVKARFLDGHYNLEDDMLTRGTVDRSALLNVLKGKGSQEDKLRTAIVYLLSVDANLMADVEAVETALKEIDADHSSFLYIKKMKSLNMTIANATAGTKSNLADWAGKLYGQSMSAVTTVKNFWSGGRQVALSKAVEVLMEARPGPDMEAYLRFDPRSPQGSSAFKSLGQGPFKEAIVFIIGGGNYNEYSSLQELAHRQPPFKNIMYGSTEILTGEEFVDQLADLGRKMGVGGDL